MANRQRRWLGEAVNVTKSGKPRRAMAKERSNGDNSMYWANGPKTVCEQCASQETQIELGYKRVKRNVEMDEPRHCAHCGAFAKNALSEGGLKLLARKLENNEGDAGQLESWAEFYGSELTTEIDLVFSQGRVFNTGDFDEKLKGDLDDCARPGRNDDAVEHIVRTRRIVVTEAGRKALEETGAWERAALADHEENKRRLVWLLAHGIADNGLYVIE